MVQDICLINQEDNEIWTTVTYFCMCWSQKNGFKKIVCYLFVAHIIYLFISLFTAIYSFIYPSSGNPCQSDFYPVLLARWSNFTSIFFIFQMGWFNHNHQRTHNFGGRKSMPLKICSPKAGRKTIDFILKSTDCFFWMIEKRSFWKNSKQDFHSTFLTLNLLSVVSWYFLGCYHRKVSIKKIKP